MLIDQAGISRLIPHAGCMILIDAVVSWDAEEIRCTARSHRNVDNPLRDCGRLHCLSGIEYAAQSMAAHGTLAAQNGQRLPVLGYLASVRDLIYSIEWLDEAPEVLEIWAKCLFHNGFRSIYQFSLSGEGVTLLSGCFAVVYVPAEKGM